MANIRLPQARFSQAPQPKKREVPVDAIIKTLGNNPYANALDQIAPALSKALERRAELRRQAQAVNTLAGAAGEEAPGDESGLTPELYEKFLTIKDNKRSKTSLAANQKVDRELALEKVRSGYVERDPTTGVERRYPGAKDISIEYDEAGNPFIVRGQDYAPKDELRSSRGTELADEKEKNRQLRIDKTVLDWKVKMRNDPEIKTLYSQKIGLGQIDDITKIAQGGNTVAATALGVKMARGMGEVGVLTDGDVTRYVQSGRLDRKAGDILSRWLQGRPTTATMAELSQISNVLQDNFIQKVQPP